MGAPLLAVDPEYLDTRLELKPGERLHPLVARLFDTHIDDLTDFALEDIGREIDRHRITHASGKSLRR